MVVRSDDAALAGFITLAKQRNERQERGIAGLFDTRIVSGFDGTRIVTTPTEGGSQMAMPALGHVTASVGDEVLVVRHGPNWVIVGNLTQAAGTSGGITQFFADSRYVLQAAANKSTPVDADEILIRDSAAGGATKELPLSSLILNYMDSRYYAATAVDALIAGLTASIDGRRRLPVMVSGGAYDTTTHGLGRQGSTAGANFAADTLYLVPMDFSAAVTVATVGLNVSTLAASGAARIGLFDFDPTTGTATRLHDFGTVATPSTGDKTVTGLSAAVTVGRHWFGILLNATTGLTYHLPAHGLYRISSTSWGAGYNKGSVTYGTFASSYSTVTGTLNACPLLWAVLA